MGADFFIVFQWWGTLFLVGAAAFPLTKALFSTTSLMLRGALFAENHGGEILLEGGRATPMPRYHRGEGWWDGGYFFSKAVGMAVVTWIVYAMGMVRVFPFSTTSIIFSLAALFLLGLLLNIKNQRSKIKNTDEKLKRQEGEIPAFVGMTRSRAGMRIRYAYVFILEELFFLGALLLWSWVKAHEPSIRGLEKFMDFGFMASIMQSRYFPPPDMWYAGSPINYYYFGHMAAAVLTKLSRLELVYTFNLMLATIFALTLTMSFSIGVQLVRIDRNGQVGRIGQIGSGLLTAFLVTLAGNMQTLYAFTRGYTGDNVKPFWELLWPVSEFWQRLPEGMRTYWYANATRFIPFTIHEFPSYSFVVSDIHGHVLSLPFVLLAIGMLINMVISDKQQVISNTKNLFHFSLLTSHLSLIFYGFLVGVLLMTNALDGPVYALLFLVCISIFYNNCYSGDDRRRVNSFWIRNGEALRSIVVLVGAGLITSLPFLSHFKSFVSGIAVNCPPAFLANSRIGPLIFEGVEKCQRSPPWMWWILWGFFLYCGTWLVNSKIKNQKSKIKYADKKLNKNKSWITEAVQIERLLLTFFLFSLALVIFPEFFYFKDIYPAHFRSNTMFKLGYQAFILFSIVSAYIIVKIAISDKRDVTCLPAGTVSRKGKFLSLISYRLSHVVFFLFLLPQLFLVSIYPYFSVRSYFGELREYKGLDGLAWFAKEYPDDWAAIRWLNSQNGSPTSRFLRRSGSTGQVKLRGATSAALPTLVEADGDSYTDYNRFSAFTGTPTIVGWAVHEWLWRGSYDVVAPRREDVRLVYESDNPEKVRGILNKYNVRYIIVGTLERQKFIQLRETVFNRIAEPVFVQEQTTVYRVY